MNNIRTAFTSGLEVTPLYLRLSLIHGGQDVIRRFEWGCVVSLPCAIPHEDARSWDRRAPVAYQFQDSLDLGGL